MLRATSGVRWCRMPGHDHPAAHPYIADYFGRPHRRAAMFARTIFAAGVVRGGVLWPDVNHYHPVTDEAAFAKSSAPILEYKLTELSYVDPTAAKHRGIALAHGRIPVPYAFLRPGSGSQQARDLVRIGGVGKGVVGMGDDEAPGLSDALVDAFNNEYHALTGYWPVGYGLSSRRRRWSRKGQLYITADYRPGVFTPPFADQYSDGKFGDAPHSWPGVGACDMNQLRGDLADIQKLAGTSPAPTPAPQPPADTEEEAWLVLGLM